MSESVIPPPTWRKRNIDYKTQLTRLHPTSKGINVDEETGDLISIQITVPNIWYNDSFCSFQGNYLYYCPSNTHLEGNNALKRAYRFDQTFLAYCGFKCPTQNNPQIKSGLEDLGVPKSYWGKCFDLGAVRIVGRDEQGRWKMIAERFMDEDEAAIRVTRNFNFDEND